MLLFYIILISFLVALISFAGRLFVIKKHDVNERWLHYLVTFSIGVFLGLVFLDLLPEALENQISIQSFLLLFLSGILFFFMLERYLIWHHCHEEICDLKASKPFLVLLGDAVHNFIDGIVIAVTLLISLPLGLKTSFAIMMHEIPQEIADFSILKKFGLPLDKLFKYNFFVALTTLLGALLTYFFASLFSQFYSQIITLLAGGFLYIAIVDLIPEIHKTKPKSQIWEILVLFTGIGIMRILA